MTIKEVIKYIECGAIPYCPCASNKRHGGDCAGEDAVLEALKTAVKVLKKQIPKKPFVDDDWYCCPTCGKALSLGRRKLIDHKYEYCRYCGQLINWSDDDDE